MSVLTRLRIDRFRNVTPGTTLEFGPTFNVLLGKNATGKTTLLNLLAAVLSGNLFPYREEEAGYQLTWWLEADSHSAEVTASRTRLASPTAMPGGTPDLEGPAGDYQDGVEFQDEWVVVLRRASLEIGRFVAQGSRASWRVTGAEPKEFEIRGGFPLGSFALVGIREGAIERESIAPFLPLLRHRAVERLDEALGSFHELVNSAFSSQRDNNGRTISLAYGKWLHSDLVRALADASSQETTGVEFASIPAVAAIPNLLGFKGARVRARLLEQVREEESTRQRYRGLDIFFRRMDGTEVSRDLLSFGQKRLFTFLWYVGSQRESPIVADELLNGLHHEWIEACVDRLRSCQSFLATQHPMLLDHIPVDSSASVRRTFVRCTVSLADGREHLAWRNFTEVEAEAFHTAHGTGIQHISEILRSEGLW